MSPRKLLCGIAVLVTSQISLAAEHCSNTKENQELIEHAQNLYQRYETLYTGGYHWSYLGSVHGSISNYLILSNNHAAYKRVKQAGYGSPQMTLLKKKSWWTLEKRYKEANIAPYHVVQRASKTILNGESAYTSFPDNKNAYPYHVAQAAYDLDVLTAPSSPMNWWLNDRFPAGFGENQHAVWKASKNIDLVDWLQFTATTSNLSHNFNWAFEAPTPHHPLVDHAKNKWRTTKSFAWLAALAEVTPRNNPAKSIVKSAVLELIAKVDNCTATAEEQVALALTIMNATRLSDDTDSTILNWLANNDSPAFANIKAATRLRYGDRLLAEKGYEAFKQYWQTMPEQQLNTASYAATLSADTKGAPIHFSYKLYAYRFASLLPSEKLELVLEKSKSDTTAKQMLSRTIFVRHWIHQTLSQDDFKRLKQYEPKLADALSEIEAASGKLREALLLKLVMKSPAMTYVLPTDLFAGGIRNNFISERDIDTFERYNPNDGSWWCEKKYDDFKDRALKKTLKDLGLVSDHAALKGYVQSPAFRARQQREARRAAGSYPTDAKLLKQIETQITQKHEFLAYSDHPEWNAFKDVPAAPILFAQMALDLNSEPSVPTDLKQELLKLSQNALERTCRNDKARSSMHAKISGLIKA